MALTGTDRGGGALAAQSASSMTVSPTSTIAAGSLGVLFIAYDNSVSGGADPYSSIATDSAGNTWTPRQNFLRDPGAASAGLVIRAFTSDVATALTSSGTLVITTTDVVVAYAWVFHEVTAGAGNTATYLTGGGSAGGSGSSGNDGSVRNIASGDLMLSAIGLECQSTQIFTSVPGSPWTAIQNYFAGSSSTNGMGIGSQRDAGPLTNIAYQLSFNALTRDWAGVWVSVDEVTASQSINLTGVSSAAAVGTLQLDLTLPITGLAPSGGVGSVTITPGAVSINGIHGFFSTTQTYKPLQSVDGAWQRNSSIYGITLDRTIILGNSSDPDQVFHGGFRFQGVQVEQGQKIEQVLIELFNDFGSGGHGVWYCEAIDDSPDLTAVADIYSRARTTANVAHAEVGLANQRWVITPNLASCLQEVVDRAGWVKGNSVMFLFIGDNTGPTTKSYQPASYTYDWPLGTSAPQYMFRAMIAVQEVGRPGVSAPGDAQNINLTGVSSAAAVGVLDQLDRTINLTGVSSIATVGTVTTAQGGVSISLTGIASIAVVGSPSVSGASGPQNITLTGLVPATVVGTITTTQGGVSITLAGINSLAVVGTIEQLSRTIPLTGLDPAGGVGTITTTQGPVSISLTGIASTTTVSTASVSSAGSPQNITLTGVSSTSVVGTVEVLQGQFVSLTGVNSAASVGIVSFTVGGVSRTLTGVASLAVVGTASVMVTTNIVLTGVGASGGVGTLAFTLTRSIALTGVDSSALVGAASVTPGTVTQTLTGVATTGAVGTVTLTKQYNLVLTGYLNPSSFGAISFTTGTALISLTGVDSSSQVGVLKIKGGGVEHGERRVGTGRPGPKVGGAGVQTRVGSPRRRKL